MMNLKPCSCSCWVNIIYNYVISPELVLFTESCVTGIITWQYYDYVDEVWIDVQSGGTTHMWSREGMYRVKITKTNCCDTYSNIEITYNI